MFGCRRCDGSTRSARGVGILRGVVVVSYALRCVGGIVSGSCERGLRYVVGSELGSRGGVVCGVYATLK